jgi:DNA-binding GntR family transcriptional regulator
MMPHCRTVDRRAFDKLQFLGSLFKTSMEAAFLNSKPVSRQTLGDSVADLLRDAIFGGRVKPGQRLAEGQIAKSLKVSRAPVRDALAGLEREGLVHRAANGGTTVTRLTLKDVDEICTLRLFLELLAIRRVIRYGTEGDWAQLADNIRHTENVGDPQELAQLDLDFHEAIVQLSGHARLLSTWLTMRSQVRLIMIQRNLSDEGSRQGTVHGHEELLKALRNRDEAAARACLERNLQNQYDWIARSYSENK